MCDFVCRSRYTGTQNFDQFVGYNDGSLPYLEDFLTHAGVRPRVVVSVTQVETPLLLSDGGAVLTLLNWRSDSHLSSLSVTVRLDFDVQKVTAVRSGSSLSFNMTEPQQGSEWYEVSFTTELTDCDFITLKAK